MNIAVLEGSPNKRSSSNLLRSTLSAACRRPGTP